MTITAYWAGKGVLKRRGWDEKLSYTTVSKQAVALDGAGGKGDPLEGKTLGLPRPDLALVIAQVRPCDFSPPPWPAETPSCCLCMQPEESADARPTS